MASRVADKRQRRREMARALAGSDGLKWGRKRVVLSRTGEKPLHGVQRPFLVLSAQQRHHD